MGHDWSWQIWYKQCHKILYLFLIWEDAGTYISLSFFTDKTFILCAPGLHVLQCQQNVLPQDKQTYNTHVPQWLRIHVLQCQQNVLPQDKETYNTMYHNEYTSNLYQQLQLNNISVLNREDSVLWWKKRKPPI